LIQINQEKKWFIFLTVINNICYQTIIFLEAFIENQESASKCFEFKEFLSGRMPKQKKKLFDYKRNRPWVENLYIVTQLGLTMAGCITFCFFIGLYLDRWLGTRGVFITIFIILGVIGGANVVYRQILEITEEKENNKINSENGDA
jgi:ATP synthase protein I